MEDKYKAKLAKKGIFKKETKAESHSNSSSEDSSDYSDSESDEEEDEFGELLTPAVDAQILKTLSEIRAGSAKIYDSSVNFFDPVQLEAIEKEWRAKHGESNKAKIARNEKPVTLKDYHRELLLSGAYTRENETQIEEDDNDNSQETPLTHVQEQEMLKNEIKAAFKADGSSDEDADSDGDGGLFQKRARTAEEIAREEEDYRNFLLENLATAENAKESMADWLNYRAGLDGSSKAAGASSSSSSSSNNILSQQSKDDAFLIDYVLNKGWMDKSQSRIPSYDQVVAEVSASEEELEKAEEFEAALNFRFEQEGGQQIQTYSRQIEGSLRRTESKRKLQREAAKQRKAEEKARKAEELKRLKNLKLAEIRAKLEKIQKITKTSDLPEDDLIDELADEEFDAAKHDALMAKIAQNVGEDEDDNVKPEFSDVSDIEESDQEGSKASKKDKKDKSSLSLSSAASSSSSSQPVKNARKAFKTLIKETAETDKTLAAAMDELYQLDYEDLIGDIPCRFKYQRTEASTFGLEIDDILKADDADLNKYFALKKLAPYRPAQVIERDVQKYATSKRLKELRKSIKKKEKEFEKQQQQQQEGERVKHRKHKKH